MSWEAVLFNPPSIRENKYYVILKKNALEPNYSEFGTQTRKLGQRQSLIKCRKCKTKISVNIYNDNATKRRKVNIIMSFVEVSKG